MLRTADLNFFCNCLVKPKYQRPRAHERTTNIPQNLDDSEAYTFTDVVGVIAEDFLLTQGAEQHDHGTIDEVLGDSDMERGGDDPEEPDRDVEEFSTR